MWRWIIGMEFSLQLHRLLDFCNSSKSSFKVIHCLLLQYRSLLAHIIQIRKVPHLLCPCRLHLPKGLPTLLHLVFFLASSLDCESNASFDSVFRNSWNFLDPNLCSSPKRPGVYLLLYLLSQVIQQVKILLSSICFLMHRSWAFTPYRAFCTMNSFWIPFALLKTFVPAKLLHQPMTSL